MRTQFPPKFQYTYYGQAPGRFGFTQEMTGFRTIRGGLRVARQSSVFTEGFAPAPKHFTLWWPPPPEFALLSYHSSKSEWLIYRALTILVGPEGGEWNFQYPVFGGREQLGGNVIDFALATQEPAIAIRLQSERFHVAVDLRKRVFDEDARARLTGAGWIVVDIYEERILPTKETGSQAMYWTKMALMGISAPPPSSARVSTARR